jgi:MacB-like periplasmic core domain
MRFAVTSTPVSRTPAKASTPTFVWQVSFGPCRLGSDAIDRSPGWRRTDDAQPVRAATRRTGSESGQLPGVIAATETSSLPPYGGPESDVTIPGKTHSDPWRAMFQLCSEGYFQTMGRHLLRGRLLTESDVDAARPVAVVNETLAKTYFAKQDPIGQKIKFNMLDELPQSTKDQYFEIIGVVAEAKNRGLQEGIEPEAYVPYSVTGAMERGILVRTGVEPMSMLTAGKARNLGRRPQCRTHPDRHPRRIPAAIQLRRVEVRAHPAERFRYRGTNARRGRRLQRDGIFRFTANPRHWHPYGAGCYYERCTEDGVGQGSAAYRRGNGLGTAGERSVDAVCRQPVLGSLAPRPAYVFRSDSGFGSGGNCGLPGSGAPRHPSRSAGGAALRVNNAARL